MNDDTTALQELAALRAENARLRAELTAQNQNYAAPAIFEKKQRALFDISEAAHSDRELTDVLRRIHEIITTLISAKNCFVALYDPAAETVSYPYFVDEFDPPPPPRSIHLFGLTNKVIRSGEAVLMTPEMRAERLARGEEIKGTICLDWMGVPLISDGATIGAIAIQTYDGSVRYSEADKALLEFVSAQIAVTIVRKRAAERISQLALHDPLTGLPNRVLLTQRAAHTHALVARDQLKAGWLYIDLDGFKPVNDTYGHAVGDELLIGVAQRLIASVRATDTVCRLGGDEFVVVLHGARTPQEAIDIAEKIRASLGEPFNLSVTTASISSSIGVALFPDHGTAEATVMASADKALYAAKAAGRNRVVMFDALAIDQSS